MSDTTKLTLYDHPVSSYAQKIRIALREKNVPFTSIIPEALRTGKSEPAFATANPRLEVPVLVDGDLELFDSTIILEYLEDKYPSPALLPGTPRGRALARLVEEVCDTQYEAVNWGWGEIVWLGRAGEDAALAEELKRVAARQTGELLGWLAEKLGEGEYFGGDVFGWGDVCAAAVVNRSEYYGLGPEKGSAMGRWLERIKGRDSVKKTFEEFEETAGKIPQMAGAFLSGERKREYRDHRLEWMVKSGGMSIVLDGLKKDNIRFSWP